MDLGVDETTALAGHEEAIQISGTHAVLGTNMLMPLEGDTAVFALGCFWGAERVFWQLDGVYTTAVGYAGGYTPNPTYEEACSGKTGHTEAVLVVYDPDKINLDEIFKAFWENHSFDQRPNSVAHAVSYLATGWTTQTYFSNRKAI